MVGDDIEDELHVALVQFVAETAQRCEIAEMRIMLEEIDRPVAVVRRKTGIFLDILDRGGNPERRDAEFLEIIEFIDDSLPVAAVILAERTRIDVVIVVDIAVIEAIDDNLIDDLVAPVLDVRGEPDAIFIRLCGEVVGLDTAVQAECGAGKRCSECKSRQVLYH